VAVIAPLNAYLFLFSLFVVVAAITFVFAVDTVAYAVVDLDGLSVTAAFNSFSFKFILFIFLFQSLLHLSLLLLLQLLPMLPLVLLLLLPFLLFLSLTL